MAASVDGRPADEADVVGVVGEVVEPGLEDQLDLHPPLLGRFDGDDEAAEPVRQEALEHLAVQRLLGGEVVEQAWPTDSHTGGDVVQRRALVAVGPEAGDRLVEDQLACGSGGRAHWWFASERAEFIVRLRHFRTA